MFCDVCIPREIGLKWPRCRDDISGPKGLSSSVSSALPSLPIGSLNKSCSSKTLWEAEISRLRAATTARSASSTLRDWKRKMVHLVV